MEEKLENVYYEIKVPYLEYQEKIKGKVEHHHIRKYDQVERDALKELYRRDELLNDYYATLKEVYKDIEERKLEIYDLLFEVVNHEAESNSNTGGDKPNGDTPPESEPRG